MATGAAALPDRSAAAAPGDLFLLHAGTYAEGTWTIDRHGTAERPIIYRGAGDGETILDGGGRERLVSANGVRHVWLEGLTLRRANFLFVGHSGSHFVVRRCRLEVVGPGITAINGGYDESRGFVITDNVFQGPTRWPRDRGIEEVNGVIITGAGHVVAYNRMSNLGDGVHGTQYGGLSASDIYNNDIEASTDDGIEGDYADTNVRIFRNRITNAFSGISAQPSNGGPLYRYLQCALLALQAAQRRLRRADLPQHVGAGRHPVAHRAGGRDGQRRGDAEQPLHRHERSGAPLDGRHDPLRL